MSNIHSMRLNMNICSRNRHTRVHVQKHILYMHLPPNDAYHLTTHNFMSITLHKSKSPKLSTAPGAHMSSNPLKPPSTCLVVCVSRFSLCVRLPVRPPAEDPQSSALNSRWFLSPTPSWPSAFASCLHKDVFMYVCMCRGEHGEVFQGLGGDKQRNLRPVNMDGVPAFREHRW